MKLENEVYNWIKFFFKKYLLVYHSVFFFFFFLSFFHRELKRDLIIFYVQGCTKIWMERCFFFPSWLNLSKVAWVAKR